MFKDASQFLKNQIGKEVSQSPSPFMAWLKPVVTEVADGSITFQHTVRKEMTNPFGTLHGGIIAAMIDDAIGATLIAYGEPAFYISVNLSVDYFASAREGDVVLAKTSVIKKGNRIVNARCDVWNAGFKQLLASGITNLIKTEIK